MYHSWPWLKTLAYLPDSRDYRHHVLLILITNKAGFKRGGNWAVAQCLHNKGASTTNSKNYYLRKIKNTF